jgi:hypothetical protein
MWGWDMTTDRTSFGFIPRTEAGEAGSPFPTLSSRGRCSSHPMTPGGCRAPGDSCP